MSIVTQSDEGNSQTVTKTDRPVSDSLTSPDSLPGRVEDVRAAADPGEQDESDLDAVERPLLHALDDPLQRRLRSRTGGSNGQSSLIDES